MLPMLYDAENANIKIDNLQNELAALKAKIMPISWMTAPAVIKYLENLMPRLVCVHERQCFTAVIATLKRLQRDPGALAWWQISDRWYDRIKMEVGDGD